jgi:formylglycine-generating enzyme required for sulfatase activity
MACELIRQAALGLQHAYEQGMVHRDIKPQNLMLTGQRGTLREGTAPSPQSAGWQVLPLVKVLDFGIARLTSPDTAPAAPGAVPALTQEGSVLGTPEFMAPEQAHDSHHADTRADIYSLGCTLYYLLTGRPPFSGRSAYEIITQHVREPAQPVNQVRPDVPANLAAVVQRMLAKDPAARFQTPVEVAQALLPFTADLAQAVVAVRPTAGPPGPPAVTAGPATTQPAPSGDRTAPGTSPAVPPQPTHAGMLLTLLLVVVITAVGAWAVWYFFFAAAPNPPPAKPPPESSVGLKFVRLPAADFLRVVGSQQQTVLLDHSLDVSTTEVTKGQYRQFAAAAGERAQTAGRTGSGGAYVLKGVNWELDPQANWERNNLDLGDDTPAVCVSWEDAVRFCNWLSEKDRRRSCYYRSPGGDWHCDWTADGYRLPTDAEWEYAARARGLDLRPDGRAPLTDYGWFRENAGGKPHAVAQKPANAHGLYDTIGNVWEWCWDWAGPIDPKAPRENPTGPATGTERVLRGGGWNDATSVISTGARKSFRPGYGSTEAGFRVVRNVPEEQH